MNPDRSTLTQGQVRRSKDKRPPGQSQHKSYERCHSHQQQRQVGYQLKLLRRVAMSGIVRRSRERVRMDVDIPVNDMGMREKCDIAPVPGKEQQEIDALKNYNLPKI